MDKLTVLCEDYDIVVRQIERLERELEEKKQIARDLYLQMEKEL